MQSELSGHTLKAYDAQLGQLMQLIVQMGMCVRALVLATKPAFVERSEALAEEAKRQDAEINRLEIALEEAATVTLALHNPLAVDLRFVTSALKISGMLERAGDLAKNNIKRSRKLGAYQSPGVAEKLGAMADAISSMLESALKAVEQRDASLAIAVWKHDDTVDDLYHAVVSAVQKEMQTTGATEAGTHVIFMAKNLERIADYVTNVAKTVHYVATGTPVTKEALNG